MGVSKFVFRVYRNRLPPTIQIAGGGIPSVYTVESVTELKGIKYGTDKGTYRRQVEGMIERWEEQTFNERIGLGLEFGENIVDMLYKGRRKKSSVKTKSTKEGRTTTTETYTESY